MGLLFAPDEVYPSIKEISVQALRMRDVRIVFCDLDNTLARWNDTFIPAYSRAFAHALLESRIDLCLLSNNSRERVATAARALRSMYIPNARKPLPRAIKKALQRKGLNPSQAIMIGDQVLTDVLAGNLAGVHTILVNPIDPTNEYGGTKVNRFFERILCLILNIKRTR